jgi:hypothetical protein
MSRFSLSGAPQDNPTTHIGGVEQQPVASKALSESAMNKILHQSQARRQPARPGFTGATDRHRTARRRNRQHGSGRAQWLTEGLADARERRRVRGAERRAQEDQEYDARFAAAVRQVYPACPPGRERTIAEHACRKYSGRVGRNAAAQQLDAAAVRLAVIAYYVRHAETNFDQLLGQGYDRRDAWAEVEGQVARVLARWAGNT